MEDARVTGGPAAVDRGPAGTFPASGPVTAPAGAARPEDYAASGGQMRPLTVFTGSGWDLFKIHIRNYILTILTLGVYSFWARVRVRKYLWENTVLLGENLEYTGTGGELFKSFLVVMLLGGLGMAAVYACMLLVPLAAPFIVPVILVPVGHFASYQALRYRLTRTRWHGIRGNMDGGAARYAAAGSGYSLLTLLTLFICMPLETARLTAKRLNASFFGSRRVGFSGRAKPLFASWLKSYILLALLGAGAALVLYGVGIDDVSTPAAEDIMPLVLGFFVISFGVLALAGLFTILYRAAVVRWLFGNLTFGDMRFDAKHYRAWGLFKLMLGNALLLLFTLGIAYPWTEIRTLRFFLSSIRYAGDPRLRDLLQDTLPERSRGEGLLDALDVDLAI
ncbi:conserved membrane hypothetical protein [uncultured delta proteobacterium]|uniref:DUF898 domain-containing protein n=1 Tax=uncultured delta proteobacterium TaxID=34034 RepID=A0A212KCI9_9DELT|nr:conserved membrane hypothetical protein [uncultured delta proteobacterium]